VLCPSLQNRKKLKAITRLELELLGIAVTYPTTKRHLMTDC